MTKADIIIFVGFLIVFLPIIFFCVNCATGFIDKIKIKRIFKKSPSERLEKAKEINRMRALAQKTKNEKASTLLNAKSQIEKFQEDEKYYNAEWLQEHYGTINIQDLKNNCTNGQRAFDEACAEWEKFYKPLDEFAKENKIDIDYLIEYLWE